MCRHTERILCIHLIVVQVTRFAGPKTPAKHVGLRTRLCNHHGCYLTKSPLSSTWSKVLFYKVIEHSLSSTMLIVSRSPSQCLTGTVVSPREYYFRLRTTAQEAGNMLATCDDLGNIFLASCVVVRRRRQKQSRINHFKREQAFTKGYRFRDIVVQSARR